LGQRIDNLSIGVDDNSVIKPERTVRATTQLSWWERRSMPDWMIKDLSNEGTYGEITRPTIVENEIPPIASPRPRRFVVILFTVLNRIPDPENVKKRIPSWVISPAFYAIQALYRKFNK
jgi:hypothetical protein